MKTDIKKGQVVRIISNFFTVESEDGTISKCFAKGTVRRDTDIFVGDYVLTEKDVIVEILPRKNCLIRPFVSNIDICIILIAKEPQFDGILVDKIILNCYKEGIKPVLCFNKCDLATDEEIESIFDGYRYIDKLKLSAKEKTNILELNKYLTNNQLVCFAGQSAVGKTSLLNSLMDIDLKVGGLSRIKRGKNTTRHIEIYNCMNGKIIDTCGFSMLECIDLEPEELTYYYDEFLPLQDKCKFKGCSHIKEPECAVKEALNSGKINKDRYNRYIIIYNELKERRTKKYD